MKCFLTDKYTVKKWVANTIGEKYVVPLLDVWDDYRQIIYDDLPESFVLKLNHGCAMNEVVKNKKDFNIEYCNYNLNWWSKNPYWAESVEPQYRNIPRKIIAEQYIEELDGSLYDYKIHCFHGEPKFIQCIGDRDITKHTGFQKHYDLKWNSLDWTFADYPDFPYAVLKPKCLDEMIEISKILSCDFTYVRVDLYEIAGQVYFGEMTFTPSSGIYQYRSKWNEEIDYKLGQMIRI